MAQVNPKQLKQLRQQLIDQLDWGTVDQWHSSMFDELSQKIFDLTQVNLSPATLKRFFGVVKHQGNPSITTLDALSCFLGFENWRGFKLAKKNRLSSLGREVSHRSIYVAFGFVLAILTITFIAYQLPGGIETPDGITFSSRPLTNTYPNTVIFDFDLQNIQTDQLHIQQYWDSTKTITLRSDQQQATGIYYFPGYFRAKLMVDRQPVREHHLFLRSNGWLGTIDYEPVPKYFTPETRADLVLSYPPILTKEISSATEPVITTYHYINDLGNVSGDNFSLSASIRNTWSEQWAVCQASRLYLIGTDGAMIIPFSKVGCSSDNNLLLNDVYLSGKAHDLSAFGTDLDHFTEVQIINRDKAIRVFIRGTEVFSTHYNEPMGKLVGLRFKFLGLGEVAQFTLLDQNGNGVVF